MENRLAEVVDKTVIERGNKELNLCLCESDVVDETCSLGDDATCGVRGFYVPQKNILKIGLKINIKKAEMADYLLQRCKMLQIK